MDHQTDAVASWNDDEGRYRLLVDAITDYAIFMLDPKGRVVSWNAGAERFKGYRAAEIIGQHFSRFYTIEDRRAGLPAAALREAATTGRFEREGWRVRKDGSRFWAHVVIDPIRGDGGELIGFAKVTRDLSERNLAAEALRKSEEQFRRLVQGVTDYAIFMLDRDGRVSSWNTGAQRFKGYRATEIIGQHFSRFYTIEDRNAGVPEAALREAAAEGRFEREGWRVRKDGSRFWAHVVIDAIRDDDGEVIAFAKITRDITERMEAQRALDEARTALFQSQKLEAIGQLTGGVAHDFNNLLTAILGSLDLVRRRVAYDPRISPLIENAILGAERGSALTQRMLAFARKQELRPRAVDLPALVQGLGRLLGRSLGPSVHIETDLPRDLPAVRSDPAQLETALVNLAVNARDAMPGGGLIKISATAKTLPAGAAPDLAAGEYVRLSVTDTGLGMDAETLSRATEPFFTTKGVGKGTGLGLSMVHGLAEQSGGRVVLKSRLGQGTVVEVWLPQARPGDAVAAPADRVPGAEDAIEPLDIIAVDDDSLVLMNMIAMLEDLGHRVHPATSAREALAVLARQPADLVITDYAMPEVNGLQLIEAIHARPRRGPRIILATGYAELPPGARDDVIQLSKPFLQQDLLDAIQRVYASARPAPAP